MSKPIHLKDPAFLQNYEQSVAATNGGCLSDFIKSQNQSGMPALVSDDGLQGWVSASRGVMWRLPIHCDDVVSQFSIKKLLKQKKIYLVSYLIKPDYQHKANCFHYVMGNKKYSIENLSRNTRSKIRRGFRNFSIRLFSWEDLIEKGYPALVDTDLRHGYSTPQEKILTQIADVHAKSDNHQLWGAWDGDNLAAWIEWIRVENWALIGLACSQTKYLKKYPNNALIYAATSFFISKHKCSYVSYGISSLEAKSRTLASLHRFKRQMGYEAIPKHRHFIPIWFLKPLLRFKGCSILLETLSLYIPQNSALRKIAGMTRLISGREQSPLAWADGFEL
jgi:hypothetical protein